VESHSHDHSHAHETDAHAAAGDDCGGLVGGLFAVEHLKRW
jgi:hypothetical protein